MKREKFRGMTKTQVKSVLSGNIKLGNVVDKEFTIEAFKWLYGVEGWSFKTKNREVVDIVVKNSGNCNTNCHYLVFSNGETTDISKDGRRTHYVDVCKAMRKAIQPTLMELGKSVKFPFVCPITNKLVYDGVVMHHTGKSFEEISYEFIEQNGGVDALFEYILPTIDNSTETEFKDCELKQRWIDYHNDNAVIMFVSTEGHKQIHFG